MILIEEDHDNQFYRNIVYRLKQLVERDVKLSSLLLPLTMAASFATTRECQDYKELIK